jgi:ABC-type multidrug transport system fused ATPase/permease subunit
MSNDLYESLVKKDISFFDQSKTGDIISRLDSDVQVMTDTIAFSFT